MVEIRLQRAIAAPVEQVFDWLAEPANLAAAPLALKAAYAKDSPGPGVGSMREVIGVGTWFREEITAYDRPRSYSYLIVRSFPPFNHDGGTLTFTASTFTASTFSASGSGPTEGTHVEWLTNYTHPAWAGGKLRESVSYRLLRSSFVAILDGCAKALQN
jgi:uncharacterized protein YndB with AHSA1/START domain